MLKVKEKGDPFVVIPAIVDFEGVELKVFIAKGEGADNVWLNALYYNDIVVSNADPLYVIVAKMISDKVLQL